MPEAFQPQQYRAINYENLDVMVRPETAVVRASAGEWFTVGGLFGVSAQFNIPEKFNIDVGIKGDAVLRVNLNRSGTVTIPIMVGSPQFDTLLAIYNNNIRCDVRAYNLHNYREEITAVGSQLSVFDPLQAQVDGPEVRSATFLVPNLRLASIRTPEFIAGPLRQDLT